ncbi:MAG: hypothetical protein GWO39_00010 [Gammaproteobacteria bacterium]|nr:hypothetical protein [Gammaproteobacteria bacterium]NIR96502.1 hypothetical protein [Gammaproteobacteria bacterium]NIT62232.1 hypothetical protein [Gammaproteobacteria bacterium]NIY30812.1 hypothetical protein [Gammaproteobacteria bacterium]
MRYAVLAAFLVVALSGPALAFHCPNDMAKIDAALAKDPQLSPERMAEVKKRRAEGEVLHNGGKHQEAVDTLARAMEILGIK